MARATRTVSINARWMGRIEERLENLGDDFKRVIDAAAHERRSAAEQAKDILDGMAILSNSMRALTDEVQAMKPIVTDFQTMRTEGRGMGRLLHWIYVGIAAVGASAITELSGLLRGATH